MYKITFYLDTPLIQTEPLMFDGILAGLWAKLNLPQDKLGRQSIPKDELIDFSKVLPLRYDPNGLAHASEIFYLEDESVCDTIRFRCKWDANYDWLVGFGKKKESVSVQRGEFKSHDIPYPTVCASKVWFYFESDNLPEVENLLQYLQGLGKKAAVGRGAIERYEIEETTEVSFEENILRPIPCELLPGFKGNVQLRTVRPPYWELSGMVKCFVP